MECVCSHLLARVRSVKSPSLVRGFVLMARIISKSCHATLWATVTAVVDSLSIVRPPGARVKSVSCPWSVREVSVFRPWYVRSSSVVRWFRFVVWYGGLCGAVVGGWGLRGFFRMRPSLSVFVRRAPVRSTSVLVRGASVRRGWLDCDIIPLFKEA